jgi:hypothetical protein
MRPVPPDPDLAALPELLPSGGVPGLVAQKVQEMTCLSVRADGGELCHFQYRPSRYAILTPR